MDTCAIQWSSVIQMQDNKNNSMNINLLNLITLHVTFESYNIMCYFLLKYKFHSQG